MESSQLLKGVLDAAVLAVVQVEDGYGYGIVRRLRASGIDQIADASVYGTLRRLHAAGSLSSYDVPSPGRPHRKYYAITAPGRRELQHHHESWTSLVSAMAALYAAAGHVGTDREDER